MFNGNPETIFQGIAPQLSVCSVAIDRQRLIVRSLLTVVFHSWQAEEQEVLQAIAKLPGHILYKDTQQTLQR